MILRIAGCPVEDAREGKFFLVKRIPVLRGIPNGTITTDDPSPPGDSRYFLLEEPIMRDPDPSKFGAKRKPFFHGVYESNLDKQYLMAAMEAIEILQLGLGYCFRRLRGETLYLEQEMTDITSDPTLSLTDPSELIDPKFRSVTFNDNPPSTKPGDLVTLNADESLTIDSDFVVFAPNSINDSLFSQESINVPVSDTSSTKASPRS